MTKNSNEPIERVSLPTFDDRQIYNNAIAMTVDSQAAFPSYAMPQGGRRTVKSKTTTTSFIVTIFAVAIIALFYTHNVIMVNSLLREISDLNAKYVSLVSVNEVLKSEIAKKESLERISLIAQEKLGMVNPKEQPQLLEVSQEKIEAVQEALDEK